MLTHKPNPTMILKQPDEEIDSDEVFFLEDSLERIGVDSLSIELFVQAYIAIHFDISLAPVTLAA